MEDDEMEEFDATGFELTPLLVQHLILEWQGHEFAVSDLCTFEELQSAFDQNPRSGMRTLILGRIDARMQDAPPEE